MKQALFYFYLIVQSKARERGWMQFRPLWKASRWLYRRLRCGPVFATRVKGLLWHLDPQDEYFTQTMVLTGIHEEWETPLFLGWLKPGMTVVDVGAHVGYYTVLSAKQAGPSGRVVAFEPDSHNRSLLIRNVEGNHCVNVEVAAEALSDHCGEERFFLDPSNYGAHRLLAGEEKESYPVRVTTLDEYFKKTDMRIDAMKIDVEAAEYLVWRGMQGLLNAHRVDRIFIEIWAAELGRFGRTIEGFTGEIAGKGFRIFMIDESEACLEARLKEASAVEILKRSQRLGYAQVFLIQEKIPSICSAGSR